MSQLPTSGRSTKNSVLQGQMILQTENMVQTEAKKAVPNPPPQEATLFDDKTAAAIVQQSSDPPQSSTCHPMGPPRSTNSKMESVSPNGKMDTGSPVSHKSPDVRASPQRESPAQAMLQQLKSERAKVQAKLLFIQMMRDDACSGVSAIAKNLKQIQQPSCESASGHLLRLEKREQALKDLYGLKRKQKELDIKFMNVLPKHSIQIDSSVSIGRER